MFVLGFLLRMDKPGLITTLSQNQPEANRIRIDGQRVKYC